MIFIDNIMTTSALIGKQKRLNRIFNNGRTLIIPLDDSLISGPKIGLDILSKKISDINSAQPNAILAYPGTLRILNEVNKRLPTVLNITASTSLSKPTNKVQVFDVKKAVSFGCDAVAIHINFSSKYESYMLEDYRTIYDQCEQYGLPLMIIAYPRKEIFINNSEISDNYEKWKEDDIERYTEIISHCARISFELGADIIKTHYTGSKESFKNVIEAANGVPVLISGGNLMDEKKLFEMCRNSIDAGAAGACIGRNVFSRDNSETIVSLLKEIIFDDLSVSKAIKKLSEVK